MFYNQSAFGRWTTYGYFKAKTSIKEYLANLQKAVKENPELLECTAIFATDPEGNYHYTVHYHPTPGKWSNDDGFQDKLKEGEKPNAVCIN